MEKIYDELYCEEQKWGIDREIEKLEEEIKLLKARKLIYGLLPQINENGSIDFNKGFYSATNNHREGWRNVYDALGDFESKELPYIKMAAAEFGMEVSGQLTESEAVATYNYYGDYSFRLIYTLTFARRLEETVQEQPGMLVRTNPNQTA